MIKAIKAAKTTAQSAEVTAGLTWMRAGNLALIQPLISAAAVIRGTNARSNTARAESRETLAAAIPPIQPASQEPFRREKNRRQSKGRQDWYGRHKVMAFRTS